METRKITIKKYESKLMTPIKQLEITPEVLVSIESSYKESKNAISFDEYFTEERIQKLKNTTERSGISQPTLKKDCEDYAPHIPQNLKKMDMLAQLLDFIDMKKKEESEINEIDDESSIDYRTSDDEESSDEDYMNF